MVRTARESQEVYRRDFDGRIVRIDERKEKNRNLEIDQRRSEERKHPMAMGAARNQKRFTNLFPVYDETNLSKWIFEMDYYFLDMDDVYFTDDGEKLEHVWRHVDSEIWRRWVRNQRFYGWEELRDWLQEIDYQKAEEQRRAQQVFDEMRLQESMMKLQEICAKWKREDEERKQKEEEAKLRMEEEENCRKEELTAQVENAKPKPNMNQHQQVAHQVFDEIPEGKLVPGLTRVMNCNNISPADKASKAQGIDSFPSDMVGQLEPWKRKGIGVNFSKEFSFHLDSDEGLECDYSDAAIGDGYVSVLAEDFTPQKIPKYEMQRFLRLILYKIHKPNNLRLNCCGDLVVKDHELIKVTKEHEDEGGGDIVRRIGVTLRSKMDYQRYVVYPPAFFCFNGFEITGSSLQEEDKLALFKLKGDVFVETRVFNKADRVSLLAFASSFANSTLNSFEDSCVKGYGFPSSKEVKVVVTGFSNIYLVSGETESKSMGTLSSLQQKDGQQGLLVDHGVGSLTLVKFVSTSSFGIDTKSDAQTKNLMPTATGAVVVFLSVLCVTTPWCGELRSFKKEITRLVHNPEVFGLLKLMVVYRYSEKVLAQAMDAANFVVSLNFETMEKLQLFLEGNQKIIQKGRETITALVDEELMEGHYEYDDPFSEVNVGEGFFQTHHQPQTPAQVSGTSNESFPDTWVGIVSRWNTIIVYMLNSYGVAPQESQQISISQMNVNLMVNKSLTPPIVVNNGNIVLFVGELTRKVASGDVVEFSEIFLPIPYTGFEALQAGSVADFATVPLGSVYNIQRKVEKDSYTDMVDIQAYWKGVLGWKKKLLLCIKIRWMWDPGRKLKPTLRTRLNSKGGEMLHLGYIWARRKEAQGPESVQGLRKKE